MINMKNLLFTGNPATGKTFLARAAAYYLCHEKLNIDSLQSRDIYEDLQKIEAFINSDRCEFIQVHPSMTYEDIVYGIEIKAAGSMTVDYVEKRVKKLCDKAKQTEECFAVIFDDISRIEASALLGNLIYAMEFRNESVPLSDGSKLCIPDNVTLIFTECRDFHSGHLDYALRRRMNYVAELKSDKQIIEKYYDAVNANAGRIITDIFESIKGFLLSNAAPGVPDVVEKYMPGHGFFMVDRMGTSYFVIDKFKQKMIFQIFPFLNNLCFMKIINGDIASFEQSLILKLNTGIAGLSSISCVNKKLVKQNKFVDTFSLEDSRDYFFDKVIPSLRPENKGKDYRGTLECVLDALFLNKMIPHDILMDSLLTNTGVAFIDNLSNTSEKAAFIVEKDIADHFKYHTIRNNKRSGTHAYYTLEIATTGRYADQDTEEYVISYNNGNSDKEFIPLNGVRNHGFNPKSPVLRVEHNTANIMSVLYHLINQYYKLLKTFIEIVKGYDKEYNDLYRLIDLEYKYFEETKNVLSNRSNRTISRPKGDDERLEYFVKKISNLKFIWYEAGNNINVNNNKFKMLISGKHSMSIEAYEDLFNNTDFAIKIKGVIRMIDLKDYQQIMENIGVRQMVFQGPPGTSKTFESKRFVLKQLIPDSEILTRPFVNQEVVSSALDAYKLTEEDYSNPEASEKLTTGGWDLVQFHPSYGYEDFIRGIEVKADGGLPSYNSVNRILGKIAEFAKLAEKANPNEPPKFYLVIDEINRANIATVFGELIYGLEYRDSKVSTPYEVEDRGADPVSRTKDIVLGKNLFIIGTMNTADKSIDSIDYAIRRRFLFIDSPADRNVVISCYQNVSENDDENSIELLVFDAVQAVFDNENYFNDEYQKSDVRLGHTYFLRKRKEGYEEDFVEHFVFQIIPILREYVKDGILDTIEDLKAIEHTPSEIRDAVDRGERVRFISDNIMLYAKEFGNMTRSGKRIDNEYVGTFIEEVRTKIGY